MRKIFKFKNGNIASLSIYGGSLGKDKALLIVSKGALQTALADKMNEHEDVFVNTIEKADYEQCAIEMKFSCQYSLLVEVVADAISEVYQTDVTISDERSSLAI